MGIRQFANSLGSIMANRDVNRGQALGLHCLWQCRKVFNLFPFEQTISRSRIMAHAGCGISALIYSQGLYNFNNMTLLQDVLRKGGVFFDVGAHIGAFTLVASETASARVFAFEPHPVTFRRLRDNVALNRRANVRLYPLALGADNGTAFLTDRPASATNHLLPCKRDGAVETLRMRGEEICAAEGVAPDCIKVDVEGFEYDVLQGFGPYLRRAALVFVEMNGLAERRSTGSAATDALLRQEGFEGPYRCHMRQRVFSCATRSASEDAVYLARAARTRFEALGFTIA